jgi:WXG100 family type VII secretion target
MPADHDGEVLVRYASLESTAQDIKQQAAKLKEDLDAIQSRINGVSEVWEGEAKQAYTAAQQKWGQKTSEIYNALMAIAHRVTESSGNYHGTDKKAASYFYE